MLNQPLPRFYRTRQACKPVLTFLLVLPLAAFAFWMLAALVLVPR